MTGHAKGGAAAWQVDGVLRMLETGVVPGNRNLESVDPLERGNVHLALGDRPIHLTEPLKAALITSLGFGHVSAVLAIAHPDTFLATPSTTRRSTCAAPAAAAPRASSAASRPATAARRTVRRTEGAAQASEAGMLLGR